MKRATIYVRVSTDEQHASGPPLPMMAAGPSTVVAETTANSASSRGVTRYALRVLLVLAAIVGLIVAAEAYAWFRMSLRGMAATGVVTAAVPGEENVDLEIPRRDHPRNRVLSADIGKAFDYEAGKDVFCVRLPGKVSAMQLEESAREIARSKPPNPNTGLRNKRTVVFFYLPEVDAFGPDGPFGSPWALADLNPPVGMEEEVKIMGLTIDQEIKLLAEQKPLVGDLIGEWLEDADGGTLYSIIRRDASLFLNHGGAYEQELVEFGPEPGRLFKRKERSRAGDYYRINERGELELRDDHGLIAVGRRVASIRRP